MPHQGVRLLIATPALHTPEDIDIALGELNGMQAAHKAVEDAWDMYLSNRTELHWKAYLGTLAAFYSHAFANVPQPAEDQPFL